MSLENHGGGVSSGALLQKCNVLNDATLNIASRHFQPAGAGATVVAGAATFGNIQITATNAGDVSGAIINSINAVAVSAASQDPDRGSTITSSVKYGISYLLALLVHVSNQAGKSKICEKM
eukprot:g53403.t1